jgi:hypothetical protein
MTGSAEEAGGSQVKFTAYDWGCPLPLRLIVAVGCVAELLVRVTAPEAGSVLVGAKTTDRDAVCPGSKVDGKVSPEMLKPVPLTVPLLSVSGAVPEEVTVTDEVL